MRRLNQALHDRKIGYGGVKKEVRTSHFCPCKQSVQWFVAWVRVRTRFLILTSVCVTISLMTCAVKEKMVRFPKNCSVTQPEEVGHAPNCIMVEEINQSGARIFLGVNLEEIVARGMKKISLRVFSLLTSLVI